MFKFCVTVILYNPENSVIEAIKIYSKVFERVYIMDNSEEINEYIKTEISNYKSIKYYIMNGNKGISRALNIAFSKAFDESYDFMLTMDQDSIFLESDIRFMIDYIQEKDKQDIGIYATNFCLRYYDRKKECFVNSKPRSPKNIVKKVISTMTSGSFVKMSAIEKIMPLDENYFIAYVDFDLGIQMKLAGYSTLRVGGALFYQQMGGVVNKSIFSELLHFTNHTSIRYYYIIRNNFYFRNKYKNHLKIKLLSYKQIVKYIFKIATSEHNKIKKIKMGYRGYCDYKKSQMGKKLTSKY